jgi:putative aldouronate transport system substrate-binding protein
MGMAPAGSLHNSYIKQGKLTKLDTLIKEYGPNIQKVFSSYPESQYLCTADDGNIYMLPMVNDAQNYCDYIFINKSWLSAVGKSVPTTTDDFKAVLDAFKSKYAGKTPFVVTSDAGEDVGPAAFGPFGISTYHNWMYIDQATDEIKYTCTSEAYRNGLRYYNSLYSAGLMKFAVNEEAVRKMTDADTVGAVLCNDYSKAFDANTFNSNWTMVPVLNTQSGGTWANEDAMLKPNAQQKYYYPHLAYTESDTKNIKDLGDYGNYAYQLRKNFITGTKSIDSDWDSYVATMNSTYKMNTVVQVNNTAYKRYKAWLATKK